MQLSRDLQNDFYAYFPRVFGAITKLLDTQNTEILEWSFQTLSYLFKFLWRYMLKDLTTIYRWNPPQALSVYQILTKHFVYRLYSPLFQQSAKEYIRNFAAESFAFLMRKIVDKNELFDFLITRLINHPEVCTNLAKIWLNCSII